MRVLVVDDDPELAELLAGALVGDGHVVELAADLATARQALLAEPNLIVLDLGLPDGSGLTLCRELREAGSAAPILLLTAQSAVSQRVAGLDAGADDYLTKPFAVAELRARVRALGRRRGQALTETLTIGAVRLELSRRRATRDGAEVELTLREWGILEALAARQGRVVARATILDEVWGECSDAAAGSLEVLVARIRRKLGREVIRTLRGEGYSLG